MTQSIGVPPTPAQDRTPPPDEGWTARNVARVIVLVLVGEFGFMSYAFPTGVLSSIAQTFQTTQAIWVVSAYAIGSAACAPLLGRLGDIVGKKRILLIMLTGGAVGGLIVVIAPTFGWVILGRALQGLSLGLAFMNASLVRDIFPARIQSVATAFVVTGSGLLSIATSLALAPVIGAFGWRGVIWVPAVYAVVVGLVLLVAVPESPLRDRGGAVDVLGAVLLAGAVTCLLIPTSLGGTWGWTAPQTLALFAVGIVLAVLWIVQALRSPSPLIVLRNFGHAPLGITAILAFIGLPTVTAVYSFWSYVIPTPASAGLGYGLGLTPSAISLYTALFAFGSFIGGYLTGRAFRSIPAGAVAMGVFALTAVGYAIAAFSLSSPGLFGLGVLLLGTGSGGAYAVFYNLVAQTSVPRRQASTAAAVTVAMNLGGAIFPVVMFAILNSAATAVNGVEVYSLGLIRFAFLVPVGLAAVLVVLGAVLLGVQRRSGGQLRPAEERVPTRN